GIDRSPELLADTVVWRACCVLEADPGRACNQIARRTLGGLEPQQHVRRTHDLLDGLSTQGADAGSHHLVRPPCSIGRDRNDGGQSHEIRAYPEPDAHQRCKAAEAPQGDSQKWRAAAPYRSATVEDLTRASRRRP